MTCLDYSIKLRIPGLCLNLLTKNSSNWRISSNWRLFYCLAHCLYPPPPRITIFQILFLLLCFAPQLWHKSHIWCACGLIDTSQHLPIHLSMYVFSHQTSSPHYVLCTVPGNNNTGTRWTLMLMRKSSLFKKEDQHINPI